MTERNFSRKWYGILLCSVVFLLFFLLPCGWSKHWLIPESLVNGVLVDYLMPAVWIQDVIIVILLIGYGLTRYGLKNNGNSQSCLAGRQVVTHNRVTGKHLIPLLLLLPSIIFSQNPVLSLIYIVRFLLALGAGFLIVNLLYNKRDKENYRRAAVLGLSAAAVWTGILAILQFVKQKTVFGWWFLGEPIFNAGYTGVKKIEIFNKVVVAPMATFPHSNVLSGFALLSLIILCRSKKVFNSKRLLTIYWLAKFFCFNSLILSFSFYTWFIYLLYLIVEQVLCSIAHQSGKLNMVFGEVKGRVFGVFKFIGFKKSKFSTFSLLFLFLLFTFLTFFLLNSNFYILNSSSITRRLDLVKISLAIIKDHVLFGVGWGCFTKVLPIYWQRLNISFRFLQPVHNVFLLMLSEIGIIGSTGIILLVCGFIRRLREKRFLLLSTSHFLLFLLFLFDHYFWSTTQGIYMLFLTLPILLL